MAGDVDVVTAFVVVADGAVEVTGVDKVTDGATGKPLIART